MKVDLGGNRLGSGGKNEVNLHNYGRSSHDLSYVWRSTMAAGTLVPFMKEVALPGDSWNIDLDANVLTHPTIGPLFGSYKVQLDVFVTPVRLYQAKLNMNALNIGRDMEAIKLPQIRMQAGVPSAYADLDLWQINPSSIFSYLDIRGLGSVKDWSGDIPWVQREFNAIPWLIYCEIYKNYYANKQEEQGAVIHYDRTQLDYTVQQVKFGTGMSGLPIVISPQSGTPSVWVTSQWGAEQQMIVTFSQYGNFLPESLQVWIKSPIGTPVLVKVTEIFADSVRLVVGNQIIFKNPTIMLNENQIQVGGYFLSQEAYNETGDTTPLVSMFKLDDIDKMRMNILRDVDNAGAFIIQDGETLQPYGMALSSWLLDDDPMKIQYSKKFGQEGLLLKTYQSDLFNNWISTEWLDGDNGVNALTAVSTVGNEFTIDALNLQNKIYNLLNRIALSGGSYNDWMEAAWAHDGRRQVTTPVYIGGLSKELTFQEVVSTTESAEGQPLGTLAGRGQLTKKHKGGRMTINVDEPSYIMGIVSLTPRIDYSQGNKWDVNLKTMDDFHKPALDEIGFQDLVTDQMAYWDTQIDQGTGRITYKSAGKQPAWINYMTNVNVVRGNFALESQQMFMTLNRRYEADYKDQNGTEIYMKDLTTYIDPAKFNNIFADTRLDAQNFWVQIAVGAKTRRKMSARIIPNL